MPHVEIRVKELLDESWSEWLEGFTLTHTDQKETILTGSVVDQATLYGLIAKLRDLGVTLMAVNWGAQTAPDENLKK
jgi:hypothetical protein